jgi:putative ubiquitin-RnfH superfamily antitoxin RatB of RatAB toxin-antitoxin module
VSLRVTVAIASPDAQHLIELELADGSRVADALAAPAVRERLAQCDGGTPLALGIWSKRCTGESLLRDGDRVEVYRALVADAKALRRARARLKPPGRSRSGR